LFTVFLFVSPVLGHAIQIETGEEARVRHVLHPERAQPRRDRFHAVRRLKNGDGLAVLVFDRIDFVDRHHLHSTG